MELTVAFALVAAFAIALYVLADGFDIGVGILFMLAPREDGRDVMMESIAPVWDGNETWLVLGGSLLLAAFPIAYSVLLPAFYVPLMLMLLALAFRGVAFEFRFQAVRLRRVWDFAFAGGSVLAAFCQGLILGGFIDGVPMDKGVFVGGPFSFLTVLGCLCGIGLIGGYALLGAGWLIWKTTGTTQVFGREVAHAALLVTALMMALVSAWTAVTEPEVAARWFSFPQFAPLAALPLAAMVVCIAAWRAFWGRREWLPFLLGIVLFLLGFAGVAVSLWPYVIPRRATIWDSAADHSTLVFVGIGLAFILPIILAYLGHAYWVFRGKTAMSYGERDEKLSIGLEGRRSASIRSELHLS